MNVTRAALIGLSSLIFCVTASAQSAAPIQIPLDHALLGKDPTVLVEIGGKSYPFLFDSGGGATIISPAIASAIGCTPIGKTVAYRSTGDSLSSPRCEDVRLAIGGFKATVDASVGNIMQFFGEKTPVLGGVISLHAFEGHALTIDLANDRLIVETDSSLESRTRGMAPLRARLSRQGGGAYVDLFIAARTPHGRIWLEVDTGNTGAVFFSKSALQQLGWDLDAPNGARVTKPQTLDLIGLGPVDLGAHERDIIYDGQLNYGVLSRMLLTVDLPTGRAWARRNEPPKS